MAKATKENVGPSRFRPSLAASKTGRPDADELKRIRRYNLAVWRLVNGRGVPTREVAILTGLSEKAIRRRCDRADAMIDLAEKTGGYEGIRPADAQYLRRAYGRSDSPEVVDFLKRHGLAVQRFKAEQFDPEMN